MPVFLTWCIERIENDLNQDGIYRVAANQSIVHSLRLQVDQGVEQDKWKFGQDTHVLCGALKERGLKNAKLSYKQDSIFEPV